jgi:hypothetical protein
MIVSIIKPCSVKLDGIVQSLSPGARLHLPDNKAQQLIKTGYADIYRADIEEYRRLTSELAERDPKGGCWDWITQNRPDQWSSFLSSFFAGSMIEARHVFDEMVTAWNQHNDHQHS